MSARRLAIRQPEEFKISAKATKEIKKWIEKYPEGRQRSALIPALWIVQKDADGWLPEKALRAVGDMLGMAYIRVYEVATFYTMFNLEPVGTHFVQMCGTTPCWLRGSDELKAMLERKIGPQKTLSKDGKLSWLEVECLGACANAPMVQISNDDGDHYYEDLTAEGLEAVLDAFVAGETPKAGPQNGRHTSEPEGGAMALTTENLSKARRKLVKLPNAETKAAINYYEWDPKERRATKGGWVDPASKASRDPKKRPANHGKDLSAGLVEQSHFAGRPKRASKPVAEKPQVIYKDGPTDGAPDDLKKIKGIGPKFEAELNAKGIYYYRQIGAWKVADIKVIEEDAMARFPGRIKRDEWVKQGKTLAKAAAKPAATKASTKKAKS
ncbi:NADH dehydrogenase subunit E [Litorimonas taeanensis]|uniref:NADH dehydrogenase subunit E n=1 Tax=Litorimonas taeanensis TaxID=568099 RepID=A0A420WKV9_9PROT|nr:NADH-quinone oxidoreductase subunit NuoE [Litorimonas taeanensis]RKQ71657.1 NADH dehydrogenase subunit E [Litorimonas taeanensis]